MIESSSSLRALGRARNVGASLGLLAAGDVDAAPRPVGASTLRAQDVNVGALLEHVSSDLVELDVGDRDATAGLARRLAVLVVLLDDNTLLDNILEGNVLVQDVVNLANRIGNGLDADTVIGAGDDGVGDLHVEDIIVGATADAADGEAVAAGAVAVGEGDVLAGVDGDAVVLVADDGAGDVDVFGVADVEAVGVVAALGVAGLRVDGHVETVGMLVLM